MLRGDKTEYFFKKSVRTETEWDGQQKSREQTEQPPTESAKPSSFSLEDGERTIPVSYFGLLRGRTTVQNDFAGAFRGAQTAMIAARIIDVSNIVHERNRLIRAVFGADTATDATNFAMSTDNLTFILGFAGNPILRIEGNQLNQILRTRSDAHSAGATMIVFHESGAVL